MHHNSNEQAQSINNVVPIKTQATLSRFSFKRALSFSNKDQFYDLGRTCARSLPAVVLGGLLNVLDGVSYGMIIFPATGIFADKAGMGVSMFFVTAVISQVVYSLGGSGFAGANGSMMIEVVPFFHILATSIAVSISNIDDVTRADEIMATTLVAFALSSILTGLAFFLLGALKLGAVIGFFPRHILVGCIGGVGLFLMETGFAVSLRIPDDEFGYSWSMVKFMTHSTHVIALWTIPLALAALLRFITSRFRHQLIFPTYFLALPMIFYIIVAAGQFNLPSLRAQGWIFDMGEASDDAWWTFYTFFNFKKVHWSAIWASMPTQFALLLFNVLHPPLNVPALSVSLNEDVDTDRELVAHGYSNFLAGILGVVPNYLVYVNTLLFYRVGGDTRVSGMLLALANVALLMVGSGPIAYLPVLVVSALIFVLGIDLIKEALWDTRHRVSWTEYITIISIMLAMTIWDFVTGVLFGIIVCCVFFVAQNSQRRSVRTIHTGDASMSTVRRPGSQRAYLREVCKQTTVLRLQGFLFFGTITSVEETIRSLISGPCYTRNPVRFLVVDLTLVAGVDMSAAEAFVRVQRLLHARGIILLFCGLALESPIGKSLCSVGLLDATGVEVFETFNDAMEWTENAYLRAWFRSQKRESTPVALPGRQDAEYAFDASMARSPRLSHLRDAGDRTIANEVSLDSDSDIHINPEPYNTLIKTFSSYGHIEPETMHTLSSYFQRQSLPQGFTLFSREDDPDGMYVIESGVLRASYMFAAHTRSIEESMVPFTLAGEMSCLSNTKRNATVTVERQAVVWKLTSEALKRLEEEHPDVAKTFVGYVLKAAKFDTDILLSALATRY